MMPGPQQQQPPPPPPQVQSRHEMLRANRGNVDSYGRGDLSAPRSVGATRAWFGALAGFAVLSGLVPIGSSGSEKLFDSGAIFIVAILMPAGLMLVAAIGIGSKPRLAGLGGGAALGLSSLFIPLAVALWILSDGEGLGGGYYLIAGTAIGGVIAFLISFRYSSGTPSVNGGVRVLGFSSLFGMSLGCTLVPAGNRGIAWADYNLFGEYGHTTFALSIQALIWVPAVVGLVGFLRGDRWGTLLAFGGSAMLGWILLWTTEGTLSDGGSMSSIFKNELHPVAYVGAAGAALFLVIAMVQTAQPAVQGGAAAAAPPAPVYTGVRPPSQGYPPAGSVAHQPPPAPTSFAQPSFAEPSQPSQPSFAPLPLPGPGFASPQPAAMVPSQTEHDGHTVPRSALVSSALVPSVWLSDGTVHPLDATLLIGRDPSAGAGERAIQISDQLLSRTQVRISTARDAVWVEDVHSTNGTELQMADGSRRALVPGVSTTVIIGTRLLFGDSWAEVRR